MVILMEKAQSLRKYWQALSLKPPLLSGEGYLSQTGNSAKLSRKTTIFSCQNIKGFLNLITIT